MAKKPTAPLQAAKQEDTEEQAPKPAQIAALVLRDCALGKCRDVVLLSESDAAAGAAQGMVDTNPDAVAAAQPT